jgi:hypothetical protein
VATSASLTRSVRMALSCRTGISAKLQVHLVPSPFSRARLQTFKSSLPQ